MNEDRAAGDAHRKQAGLRSPLAVVDRDWGVGVGVLAHRQSPVNCCQGLLGSLTDSLSLLVSLFIHAWPSSQSGPQAEFGSPKL